MGIREKLNQTPLVASAVIGVLLLGALIFMLWPDSSTPGRTVNTSKRYFSVDDGTTWFAADATKIPPFQHEGKTAYRAVVVKCGDGKPFVAVLERYSDVEKKRLENAAATSPGKVTGMPAEPMPLMANVEVKRPGDKNWVRWTPQTAEQYQQVRQPRCPDGSTNNIQLVLPN